MNQEKTTNSFWQNRILLEGLVSQILPPLIKNDPKKADEVLTLMKKEDLKLDDFLAHFPEFRDVEIKTRPEILKTLNFVDQERADNFFPVADFNHDIFYYLTEIIKAKKILNVSDQDLNYQFQLRLALYKNFNRYLNACLARLGEEKIAVILPILTAASDRKQFLDLLSKELQESPDALINNFLNLLS